MAGLKISVLGSPRIEVDGAPIEVDTRKAIALLVYLAATARPMSRESLTGLLWPEYDQDRARAALRRTLSTLKKALNDRWVTADRMSVALPSHPEVSFDLADLRSALAAVDAHDHPADACPSCRDRLGAVADLVGGRFLEGFTLRDSEPFEEWAVIEAGSVDRDVASVLERLMRMHTAAGDLEAATAVAEGKLTRDPLDEPSHRHLMQLYGWRGMRTAAVRQYRECVAILDRELGVAPLPETTAVYEAIADGSVESRLEPALAPPGLPAKGPRAYPLRGRNGEWDRLLEAYAGVGRTGAVVGIQGEAGIGKTRLGREFIEAMGSEGAAVIEARCHEGESGLPYALVTKVLEQMGPSSGVAEETLAEAARLVPSLHPGGRLREPIDDPGALSRFLEAIRTVVAGHLAGSEPGVLFLDDLQWCDDASAEALGYIANRLEGFPACILLAWRSEEVSEGHPLTRVIDPGAGATLSLSRLGIDDVRALVEHSGERTEDDRDDLATRLMEETEGIPFFIVEYLSALDEGEGWQLPVSVQDLLRTRLASLGEVARQILGTAAVIDRSFDFEVLWKASGRTELETVDALDELVGRGFVRPLQEASAGAIYEFSHDKLRTVSYEEMSPARRRVLHRRVAEAFMASPRAPGSSALIARHLEAGGREPEAARYHEAAAAQARSVFANGEALSHYRAALALGHEEPGLLHEGVGDMCVLLGRYSEAIDGYEAAAALVGDDRLPDIERKLGEVHQRRGDWERSQIHLSVALDGIPDGVDDALRSRILTAMSLNALRTGESKGASELALRALDMATSAGDDRARARALNQLGILDNARSDHAAARRHLEESLELAEDLADDGGRAAALNNLAHAARSGGDLDAALAMELQALEICSRLGDSHREAALRSNIADLLYAKGDMDGAMAHLKTATGMLARIGEEPTGLRAEVWNLVEW